MTDRTNFALIISGNEKAARDAFDRGDYVQVFLLVHTLIESLLRLFLNATEDEIKFSRLIKKYEQFLLDQNYTEKTLVKEFTEFNRRRNRIVHQLWQKEYSYINRQAESAANMALILYGLSIEFIETWNPEITKIGFQNT